MEVNHQIIIGSVDSALRRDPHKFDRIERIESENRIDKFERNICILVTMGVQLFTHMH